MPRDIAGRAVVDPAGAEGNFSRWAFGVLSGRVPLLTGRQSAKDIGTSSPSAPKAPVSTSARARMRTRGVRTVDTGAPSVGHAEQRRHSAECESRAEGRSLQLTPSAA